MTTGRVLVNRVARLMRFRRIAGIRARRPRRTTTPARLVVPAFHRVGILDSCCRLVSVSSFELDGCQHAKRGVPSLPVVPDLQMLEDHVRKWVRRAGVDFGTRPAAQGSESCSSRAAGRAC